VAAKEYLEEYREGLIVTSACLRAKFPKQLFKIGLMWVMACGVVWYKERWGDDYYLEIQDHGLIEERVVNPEIVRIAQELDIKTCCHFNDLHFTLL
jgi:DNA polymerase-3 subunit alpha